MEIEYYALGINFDTEKIPVKDASHHAFELLYSELTYNELSDVSVSAGNPYEDAPSVYLVVFQSVHYRTVRNIFTHLRDSAALRMFLWDDMPFIDKNRLVHLPELTPYGRYDYQSYRLIGAPIPVYRSVPCRKRRDMEGRGVGFLFAPDSFKGSLSAPDAVRLLILAAYESHYRGCDIIPMPIADGGEGTLYAMNTLLGGRIVRTTVHDPLGNEIDAEYAVVNGDTAIVEMAQSSGLTLIPEENRDVKKASTYGTGELIMHAVKSGLRKVIVTLGGSATNDGGTGCAKALGVRFYDKEGREVPDGGEGMIFINRIDMTGVPDEVWATEFTAICDVKNPLTGINGATMTYSAQKGADAVTMFELECGMKNLRRYYNNTAGYDICKKPGAGAAGGMGAMLTALFGARLKSGIDTVLDLADFDSKVKTASLVITGEGHIDSQTMHGKAVSGVIRRAGRVPTALICGCADEDIIRDISLGTAIAAHSFITRDDAMGSASEHFYNAAVNLFNLLKTGQSMKRRT